MTQRKVSKITSLVSSKNMEGFTKQLLRKIIIENVEITFRSFVN